MLQHPCVGDDTQQEALGDGCKGAAAACNETLSGASTCKPGSDGVAPGIPTFGISLYLYDFPVPDTTPHPASWYASYGRRYGDRTIRASRMPISIPLTVSVERRRATKDSGTILEGIKYGPTTVPWQLI